MLRAPGLLVALVLSLSGCQHRRAGWPGAAFDLRLLDRAPVVPIQTGVGNASGLLREDGTILTCSHAIPRHQPRGQTRIAGRPAAYSVMASGDGLQQEWGFWSPQHAPLAARDWALIAAEPAVQQTDILADPLVIQSPGPPPSRGETLYLVAYTADRGRFVRYQLPVRVIPPLRGFAPDPSVIWLRAGPDGAANASQARPSSPDGAIRQGFSGAPVLRHLGAGRFELCAMLVDAEYGRDNQPTDVAVAVLIPPLPPAQAPAPPSRP